jgi:hypothetical protein
MPAASDAPVRWDHLHTPVQEAIPAKPNETIIIGEMPSPQVSPDSIQPVE